MRDCGVPVFARYTVRAAQTVKVRDVQNVQAAIGRPRQGK